MNFRWTEDQDAELKRLLGEGLSARQAGEKLGVSRNAAIGRAHRIAKATANAGRLFTVGHGKRPKWAKRERSPDQVRGRGPALSRRERREREAFLGPVGLSWVRLSRAFLCFPTVGRPIEALTLQTCRMPVAEADGPLAEMLFCCAPRDGGSAWCAPHRRLATQ